MINKVYQLIKANQAQFPALRLCKTLGVSRSGYYDWVNRMPSQRATANTKLTEQIVTIHRTSDSTYGRPRITAELADLGIMVNHKRVGRLMRLAKIKGVSRRRGFVTTTHRNKHNRLAPDLVQRHFKATNINQLWVADMTYIPTWAGFLYLAVVVDVFSRKVVGWSFSDNMTTSLVINALNMAVITRKPDQVIHHSDQGSQYTSIEFGKRCQEMGIFPSIGSVGDAYDNAMAESFFASLECELINRRSWQNKTAARLAIFTWIESWYNLTRRHSGLGYLSPSNFERKYNENNQAAINPFLHNEALSV